MKSPDWSFPTIMSSDSSSIKYYLLCAFVALDLHVYRSPFHVVLTDRSVSLTQL